MSAGSEFALRIALADLLARLKRSEEMCKYLERCRNEMAKELFRVKQENQAISRENSLMAASLEQNIGMQMMPKPRSPVQDSEQPTTKMDGNQPLVPDEGLDKSTDWEEITARLLNQLRKEVEQMAPKQVAITNEHVPTSIVPEEDQRNKSVGSVFVLPGSPSLIPSGKKSVKEESTRLMKFRGEKDGNASGSCCDSKFGSSEEGSPRRIEVVPGRRPLSINHAGLELENVPPVLDVTYVKLFQNLTSDLNKFAEQVAVQNEKLTRIKSKQLRSYFKRQLKPSDQKATATTGSGESGVRSGAGGGGSDHQRNRQQQHPKPGLAELI